MATFASKAATKEDRVVVYDPEKAAKRLAEDKENNSRAVNRPTNLQTLGTGSLFAAISNAAKGDKPITADGIKQDKKRKRTTEELKAELTGKGPEGVEDKEKGEIKGLISEQRSELRGKKRDIRGQFRDESAPLQDEISQASVDKKEADKGFKEVYGENKDERNKGVGIMVASIVIAMVCPFLIPVAVCGGLAGAAKLSDAQGKINDAAGERNLVKGNANRVIKGAKEEMQDLQSGMDGELADIGKQAKRLRTIEKEVTGEKDWGDRASDIGNAIGSVFSFGKKGQEAANDNPNFGVGINAASIGASGDHLKVKGKEAKRDAENSVIKSQALVAVQESGKGGK